MRYKRMKSTSFYLFNIKRKTPTLIHRDHVIPTDVEVFLEEVIYLLKNLKGDDKLAYCNLLYFWLNFFSLRYSYV